MYRTTQDRRGKGFDSPHFHLLFCYKPFPKVLSMTAATTEQQMNDVRSAIEVQLKVAREIRAQIEAEKTRTKADLMRRLEEIDATYDPRLQGVNKAIEAYEQTLSAFAPVANSAPLLLRPVVTEMKPTVKRVFVEASGAPLHLNEVERRVLAYGVQTRAANISEAVRAAIYNLIDKGEPIVRVAERTWAWQPPTEREKLEARAAT